ncbi:MAG: DUF4156 domain-containing protein [Myxococcota bacterium]
MMAWTRLTALRTAPSWTVLLALNLLVPLGCKSSPLTSHGTEVAVLAAKPIGCEELGKVVGHGGGVGGGYTQKGVLSERATERARNEAAEMGATHIVLEEPAFEHGSADAPVHDQQPALGHGNSSAAHASVEGMAYKCEQGAVPPTVASVLPKIENPSASISLLPLGTMQRVIVYQKNPSIAGSDASETETFRLEDAAGIARVTESLNDLALDPIKYIPTHRVEFEGDLGTQSLLYGFGYLQYAGKTYRLTTGAFEETLGLVEPPVTAPAGPDVETETPTETTSGGESE